MVPVRVQTSPFDIGAEIERLRAGRTDVGAVASFMGVMRDFNEGSGVRSMLLEHYPGMTERALEDIVAQAATRWPLIDTLVVHRVGELGPADPIVLVVTLSAHREAALSACAFIMDFLKTRAPFWKKERTSSGDRWVESRASDDAAADRWQAPHTGE